VNQAAQQSRPEVWPAAAAALMDVVSRFRRFMGRMVTKSVWFVNELDEQPVSVWPAFIKIQDLARMVGAFRQSGGKHDGKD